MPHSTRAAHSLDNTPCRGIHCITAWCLSRGLTVIRDIHSFLQAPIHNCSTVRHFQDMTVLHKVVGFHVHSNNQRPVCAPQLLQPLPAHARDYEGIDLCRR
uniref:Uncharacterized protein n=1 Tax=Trypanosoma congolense (strain IL3000) TaxID=1068625 RepID=G0URG1_TRYCI|nr:hypothetical protein, unlikely [Trypanosoma congolense IL3000]